MLRAACDHPEPGKHSDHPIPRQRQLIRWFVFYPTRLLHREDHPGVVRTHRMNLRLKLFAREVCEFGIRVENGYEWE